MHLAVNDFARKSWKFEEGRAIGHVEPWLVQLDPTDPSQGLHLQSAAERQWQVFQVRPLPQHSLQPDEIYTRGRDLICRFNQAESDLYAFQLDWHLLVGEGPFVVGLELWISIQTTLLDAQPQLEVSCVAGDGVKWEVWEASRLTELLSEAVKIDMEVHEGPAVIVARDQTSCGIWLIEPTDRRHVEMVEPASPAELSVSLFGHFMEKGVIRRARMRFWLAAPDIPDAAIAQAFRDFAASPLPLTA